MKNFRKECVVCVFTIFTFIALSCADTISQTNLFTSADQDNPELSPEISLVTIDYTTDIDTDLSETELTKTGFHQPVVPLKILVLLPEAKDNYISSLFNEINVSFFDTSDLYQLQGVNDIQILGVNF